MKKVLICIIIVAIGAAGVYYGLDYLDKNNNLSNSIKSKKIVKVDEEEKEETEVIPSKDSFVSEATKLQTLAENEENNQTCKCYNVKDLDKNTSLTGSILVYTSDDLFLSKMWLSNGYYILDGSEQADTYSLVESSDQASLYCGEADASTQSSLCATNY